MDTDTGTKEVRLVRISEATMKSAIERAVKYRPLVTPTGERTYKVKSINHGGYHYVEFFQTEDGRFGTCSCPAGEHGNACYAMGAALIAHLGLAKMRATQRKAKPLEADKPKAAATVVDINAARLARAQHKARHKAVRFECDGIGRHDGCGIKCRFAQRLGGIDI